jgi:hypothetical protein
MDTKDLRDAIDDAGHLSGWHRLMADSYPRDCPRRRQHLVLSRRYSAQADELRAELAEITEGDIILAGGPA